MKTITTTTALLAWHQSLADCLASTAQAGFCPRLLKALQALLSIETGLSALLGLECKGKPPRLLYHCGIEPIYQETLLERYYRRGYLLDPFCLAVDNGLAEGFYPLSSIAPDDFFRSEYYRVYYQRCGSMEDAHFIVDLEAGRKLSLCVFYGQSGGRFNKRELALLQSVWPLLRELLRLFNTQGGLADCLGVQDSGKEAVDSADMERKIRAAFNNLQHAHLTEREQQVAHLLLCGHSVKSSAKQLSISPETVRMHRKHLYSKLNIGSQAELFALFIASAA